MPPSCARCARAQALPDRSRLHLECAAARSPHSAASSPCRSAVAEQAGRARRRRRAPRPGPRRPRRRGAAARNRSRLERGNVRFCGDRRRSPERVDQLAALLAASLISGLGRELRFACSPQQRRDLPAHCRRAPARAASARRCCRRTVGLTRRQPLHSSRSAYQRSRPPQRRRSLRSCNSSPSLGRGPATRPRRARQGRVEQVTSSRPAAWLSASVPRRVPVATFLRRRLRGYGSSPSHVPPHLPPARALRRRQLCASPSSRPSAHRPSSRSGSATQVGAARAAGLRLVGGELTERCMRRLAARCAVADEAR